MPPRLSSCRWLRCLAALLLAIWAVVPTGRAQKQEEGILVKVKARGSANSESFAFDGANKAFSISSAVGSKQASVKAFSFGQQSANYEGSGAFRSKAFTPRSGGLRTEAYDAKTSALSQHNSFAQADRNYGTKAIDVRQAPAANKSASTKEFTPSGKTFELRGKRQDSVDDVYKSNKNLSVDQIRDLLNKGPAGRP